MPRPLGQQLIAEHPGEIVSFDFIHVGKSEGGYFYVLVIICKMSKTVMLVPCVSCTAPDAARALLRWCALYGLPQWWLSDGGSHFHNWALRQLAERLGIQHRFSTPYCPWANGTAERANRTLLKTLRGLISERRLNPTDWDYLLPVVEFGLNHMPRPVGELHWK